MAKVKGSALKVGDVLFGQYDYTGKYGAYHHPYLVVAVDATSVSMRNCTSHTSASYNTIKIDKTDKVGSWGDDSYLVTNATLETGLFRIPVMVASGTEQVVVQGAQQFGSYIDSDGATCFGPYTPTWIETRDRYVQKHVHVFYRHEGSVKPTRMAEILLELNA